MRLTLLFFSSVPKRAGTVDKVVCWAGFHVDWGVG